jgi:hypothetical protein
MMDFLPLGCGCLAKINRRKRNREPAISEIALHVAEPARQSRPTHAIYCVYVKRGESSTQNEHDPKTEICTDARLRAAG